MSCGSLGKSSGDLPLVMTTSAYQREYPIPPKFPAILKGFAREILRAQVQRQYMYCTSFTHQVVHEGRFAVQLQPQDIYKFAAQYFTELVASNPGPTADSLEDKAARLEADLLRE